MQMGADMNPGLLPKRQIHLPGQQQCDFRMMIKQPVIRQNSILRASTKSTASSRTIPTNRTRSFSIKSFPPNSYTACKMQPGSLDQFDNLYHL